MEPQIQYCTTSDGVSIAYYAMGDGPPIVITSNIPVSHLLLARRIPANRMNMEELERSHRVVRYDGRGSGLSQRESPDFSLAARLLDLEAVVERLQLKQFVLYGPVSGGLAAVVYAVRHPERVTHLILQGAYACGRDYWEAAPALRAFKMMRPITKDEWESYTLTVAGWNVQFSDSERAKDLAAVFRASMEPDAYLAFRDATLELDVTDLLPQVRMPTLVLFRASQGWDQPKLSQVLASRIPDARLAVLEPWTGTGVDEASLRAVEEFLGDAPGDEARILPEGTTVILFVDIVDSTALTEQLGDAAFRTKASALDERLRSIIRDGGGTPVEGKVLGDGVMAVFTSARQAIECAGACRDQGRHTGLPLHLGVHAGDVTREGTNVYGGAVNIAARIAGASAPGEVLVSRTVRDLARTSANVEFEDRGEHALKGIADPQQLFAVRTPGTD